jgi:hypothetical protein
LSLENLMGHFGLIPSLIQLFFTLHLRHHVQVDCILIILVKFILVISKL